MRCRRPRSRRGAARTENVEAGQRAYYHRAKMNSAARTGMRTRRRWSGSRRTSSGAPHDAARRGRRPGITLLDVLVTRAAWRQLLSDCCALIRRTVPSERMTIESVIAPSVVY